MDITKEQLLDLNKRRNDINEHWEDTVVNHAYLIFKNFGAQSVEDLYIEKDTVSVRCGSSYRGCIDEWWEGIPLDIFMLSVEEGVKYVQEKKDEEKKKQQRIQDEADRLTFEKLKQRFG